MSLKVKQIQMHVNYAKRDIIAVDADIHAPQETTVLLQGWVPIMNVQLDTIAHSLSWLHIMLVIPELIVKKVILNVTVVTLDTIAHMLLHIKLWFKILVMEKVSVIMVGITVNGIVHQVILVTNPIPQQDAIDLQTQLKS